MLKDKTNFINKLKIQEQLKVELLFLYERFSNKTINLINKLSFEIQNIKNNINQFTDTDFSSNLYNEFKLKVLMNQDIIENKIELIDESFKEIDLKKLEQLMNEIIYKLNENYILTIKKWKQFILNKYEIDFESIEINFSENKNKFEDFSRKNILGSNSNVDFWPYEILGISLNASDMQIKQAYKALAKKYHPDNNKDPEAEEMMKLINKAYNILRGKE
ncbi:heat shock protein chaperone [Mesoplasma florum L1]|uniref:Heat shock protein chaperone n=1 Tax=Mesoplasma florum (strain ATCC 33453 / NBRC 100688 / NCTC 11704 / L1) TaxID=265311 RepID=Q6F1G7_MESFL|nr:DnaJ domain-containing protein [Mesoplasma florum]AAT75656.1 heat shock protein chaperone [Mesoplasma florum L1]